MTDTATALAADLHEVLGQLRRRLRAQADTGDLTASQLHVLRRLDLEGPATATTLARAAGVRPQSMGATVGVLLAAGLVTGAPDPEDGRQTLLSITPASRKWLKDGRAAKQDWLLHALQDQLSPREQQELARAIVLLRRVAAQPAGRAG
ncbi:MarR family transcriptional regulator [Ramlibacter sp. XY19]|uniref:MarR family winged helix-turn-helix transcriptional regulator n=1 Tax=Ramlibacter paludis TaxID=2908000 RepID=UPI0023DB5C19|nr:MarR family transcriptional regulator [Ramlibacter paludis]MCG2592448.1 MarR family transcriptional regulator [Ramlibacter paludis]